jgi:hypothetical protein
VLWRLDSCWEVGSSDWAMELKALPPSLRMETALAAEDRRGDNLCGRPSSQINYGQNWPRSDQGWHIEVGGERRMLERTEELYDLSEVPLGPQANTSPCQA